MKKPIDPNKIEFDFLCPSCKKSLEWDADECPCGWMDKPDKWERLLRALEGIEEGIKVIASTLVNDDVEFDKGNIKGGIWNDGKNG